MSDHGVIHIEYYIKDLIPLSNLLHLGINCESLSWTRKDWWIGMKHWWVR